MYVRRNSLNSLRRNSLPTNSLRGNSLHCDGLAVKILFPSFVVYRHFVKKAHFSSYCIHFGCGVHLWAHPTENATSPDIPCFRELHSQLLFLIRF